MKHLPPSSERKQRRRRGSPPLRSATKAPRPRGAEEKAALEAALEESRVENGPYLKRIDLHFLLSRWARFVTEVEDGYGYGLAIHDYTQDVALLQEVLSITEQVPARLALAIGTAFKRWAEKGYKRTTSDYNKEIAWRQQVDYIAEQLPKRLASAIRAAFEPWDDRFRIATVPVKGTPAWPERLPRKLDARLRAQFLIEQAAGAENMARIAAMVAGGGSRRRARGTRGPGPRHEPRADPGKERTKA